MKFEITVNDKPLPKEIRASVIEYKPKNNFLVLLNKNPLLKPIYYDNVDDCRNLEVTFFINCNTHDEVYEQLQYLEGLFSTPCLIKHKEKGCRELCDDVYLINMNIDYLSITGKAHITCNFLALGNYGELQFAYNGTDINEYLRKIFDKQAELKGHKHPIIEITMPKIETDVITLLPYNIKFFRPGILSITGGDELFNFSEGDTFVEIGTLPYLQIPLKVNQISFNDTFYRNDTTFPYAVSGLSKGMPFSFKIRKRTL